MDLFQHHVGVPFNVALTKVKYIGLTKKKSKVEVRKEKRHGEKKLVGKIEKSWEDTALIRSYGNVTSISSQKTERYCRSFQSYEESRKKKQTTTKLAHGPLYAFDRDALLQEVRSYTESDAINFSELARKYRLTLDGKTVGNAGSVIKSYLIQQGIDVNAYFGLKKRGRPQKPEGSHGTRRKKQRLTCDTTFPCEMTEEKKRQKLAEQDEWLLGVPIVPAHTKKLC